MIPLRQGCRATEPKVTPASWQRANASIKKDWQIWYRFYDPRYKDKYPKGKLVPVRKFIHDQKTLSARQAVTARLLIETRKMLVEGYNPHTGEYMALDVASVNYIISPDLSFPEALSEGLDRLSGERNIKRRIVPSTASDIGVTLKGIIQSASKLGLDQMRIADVERRHIIICMDQCEKDNPRWSPARFNKYRANLSVIFKKLRRVEAVKSNIIQDIDREVVPQRENRKELTPAERLKIAVFLDEHYPEFLRFMQIFFHSSSRETELMRVQGKDVDLTAQRFWVTVIKGNRIIREQRVIKNIALPYWEAAMIHCEAEQYVFAKGLIPGDKSIAAAQISRRWAKHVKGKKKTRGKGIRPNRIPQLDSKVEADFYSLKHTNMDEIAAARGIKYASSAAGHTSERTSRLYAQREQDRKLSIVQEIENEFTPTKGIAIPLPASAHPLRAGK